MQPKSPFPSVTAFLLCGAALLAQTVAPAAPAAGRPIAPEDFYRFKDVTELQIAHDGSAVAYLVTSYDRKSDASRNDLWAVDWDGAHAVQVTHGESVSKPRFTRDGRLSFLAAPAKKGTEQLWVVARRGGVPKRLTHVDGEITDYAWSPDGAHVVLVMRARGDSRSRSDGEKSKPLVIDAFQFKTDDHGYLDAGTQPRLYLLEVKSGVCLPLTKDSSGAESLPVFAPDGRQIAYVANDYDDPKGAGLDEIRLVAARVGAKPVRLLSTWSPNHQHLEWSPDGRQLAFLTGNELKYNAYIMDHLALAEVPSGQVRPLTDALDRAVITPHFTTDGRAIQFAVEDDGRQYAAQVSLAGGAIERLEGASVATELATAAGRTAVLASDDRSPVEVYALEHGRLRELSDHNRALFSELALGSVQDISFTSSDDAEIHGQLLKPPGYVPGRRYPTIVWIHGGPNGQDDHSLPLEGYSPQLERQLFATHGYVVLAINYRGSTGRGAEFARSITADWGDKEVDDLLAGADFAVQQGIADPERLGIGGWSYGGLLTDYTIARDVRFRAAISGAGSGNQIATWGADQYIAQYNAELGPPWVNAELWQKVSYPLFRADHIRTPTLFLGGDRDFNVPIAGSEQMYQALRTLGVPAQLIVYPDETHVPDRPSFLVDRFHRYLEWMARYLGSASL